MLQRITVSIDERLAREFDLLLAEREAANRSEGVRDLMREAVEARRQGSGTGFCVAALSYIYNYRERSLPERLAQAQHDQHDIVQSTTRIHLDHEHCLESLLLKGPVEDVRRLADRIRGERGVRYGGINLISLDWMGEPHVHGNHPPHVHLSPPPG